MTAGREQSTLTIDLAGAATVLALLLTGAWSGLIRTSPAKAELNGIRTELELKRRDLAGMQRELAKFQSTLREREGEMAGLGAPPERSPIEEDLRTLSELMTRHGLHVAEVSPLGSNSYPGVLESKYRLRAGGRCSDLAQALRGFENCRFWGDITHLQISAPAGRGAGAAEFREADLTLSFYTTIQPSPATTSGTKP